MIRRSPSAFLVAIAAFALSAGVCAAADGKAATPANNAQSNANSSGKAASAAVSTDVQSLVERFKVDRERILAQREELEKKLKSANEADKKQILNDIEAQQKELIEAQRALGKKIRDEMRRLRPTATPPPGRR